LQLTVYSFLKIICEAKLAGILSPIVGPEMSESALKVFHELTSAGLLSSDAATQYSVEIESGVDALLEKLVKEKIITAYQSEKFRKGLVSDICFGDYIVITELGRGGMGTVLLARHRVMDRKVAIKVLPVTALESESAVARFYQEVKVAGKLTHQNIVHAYDAREHRGFHYLVMEYVDGHDLAQVVNEIGPLPLSLALDYIRQAALGLEYAHGENVVHRDIKPSNLLLDKQGTVKVLDMGLARVGTGELDEQSLHLTTTGQVMGTVEFMSPEQAEDTRLADAKSDIYSLGCTLFRLLSDRGPFSRDTVVKTILAHRSDPIPQLPPTGDPNQLGAQRIFEKMIAKKPADRYENVSVLLEDIDRIEELSDQTWKRQNEPHELGDVDIVHNAPANPSAPNSSEVLSITDQDFPKTAVAVRITSETADSAVDAFNRQYDSASNYQNLPSNLASASGVRNSGTIIDLSDNSTAHIRPSESSSGSSGLAPTEVFYIGEEKKSRGFLWLLAGVFALTLSVTQVPYLALILAIVVRRLTKSNIKQAEEGKRKSSKLLHWASTVGLIAIIVSSIRFVVLITAGV
jgi:serine/threonine protein kinase